jgi:hypothetical protein
VAHYVVVLTPDGLNEWMARLPDFPGCRAISDHPNIAASKAAVNAAELVHHLRARHHDVPHPRSLLEIKADPNWVTDRQINWADAIISTVEVLT